MKLILVSPLDKGYIIIIIIILYKNYNDVN